MVLFAGGTEKHSNCYNLVPEINLSRKIITFALFQQRKPVTFIELSLSWNICCHLFQNDISHCSLLIH